MIITLKQLEAHNFKSHHDLTIDFGNITRISGENAKGKSSIGEIPTFILFGLDLMGNKLDPTPIGYEFDRVHAELLLQVDDKQLLLGRGIENGDNKFWVNEVPKSATHFNDIVKSLFDKDLFLSLFNPSYFPSLKWDEQRAMILRYVSAPAKQEVFKAMIPAQADKLAELTKKHSLEDLDKIHRDNKNRKDKDYIAAQSRTKTLQEQLDLISGTTIDVEVTKARIAQIEADIKAHEESYADTAALNTKIMQTRFTYVSLVKQLDPLKQQHAVAKEDAPNEACNTCGQPLPEEAKQKALAKHDERVKSIAEQHNTIRAEALKVKAELDELIAQRPADEEKSDITAIQEEKSALQRALRDHEQRSQLQQQIESAKQAEAETLKSRNDSIFILDAIKAFEAKSAELQAAKVQSLFADEKDEEESRMLHLSFRLFKENKTDGKLNPDFELMMNGKPYRKLSLSESIRTGLKLRDVLSEQSGIVAPCFLDNSESVTRFKQPIGQLILSRVVAGQELKIEKED